jgi:hypothetical protein
MKLCTLWSASPNVRHLLGLAISITFFTSEFILYRLHICDITLWSISLSLLGLIHLIMSSRFIHVTNGRAFLFFKIKYYFFVCICVYFVLYTSMYTHYVHVHTHTHTYSLMHVYVHMSHIVCNTYDIHVYTYMHMYILHSSVAGHLGCLQILAVETNAAWAQGCSYFKMLISVLLDIYLELRLLGHISLHFDFLKNLYTIFHMAIPNNIPTNNVWVFLFPTSFPKFVTFDFLIVVILVVWMLSCVFEFH